MFMQLESMRFAAREAMRRSFGAIKGFGIVKRCWRCQHVLSRRTIVCRHCGKWQG